MHTNLLKLNSDKTEMVVFASNKKVVSSQKITINIGNAEIKPSLVVRNLGQSLITNWTWNNTSILSVSQAMVKFDRLEIPDLRHYLNAP